MNNIIKRTWNQGIMPNIEDLRGMAFQAESGAHTFVISAVDDNNNPITLSGTPSGTMLRPDNTDQALTCSVSDGKVYATLPAGCYDMPGRAGITIFLTSGGQKTAIYAAIVYVTRTQSGTASPGTTASVVDLVNAIAAAVAMIPASYTDLMAAVAPTYSSSGLYAVGSYAWYSGKLYRCTTAITTAETWTAAHWTLANLGSDLVDLKSAILNQDNFVAPIYIDSYLSETNTNYPVKLTAGETYILDVKAIKSTIAMIDIRAVKADGTYILIAENQKNTDAGIYEFTPAYDCVAIRTQQARMYVYNKKIWWDSIKYFNLDTCLFFPYTNDGYIVKKCKLTAGQNYMVIINGAPNNDSLSLRFRSNATTDVDVFSYFYNCAFKYTPSSNIEYIRYTNSSVMIIGYDDYCNHSNDTFAEFSPVCRQKSLSGFHNTPAGNLPTGTYTAVVSSYSAGNDGVEFKILASDASTQKFVKSVYKNGIINFTLNEAVTGAILRSAKMDIEIYAKPFADVFDHDEKIIETVVNVGPTRSYTTIQAAVNAITDNSINKRYTVLVDEGTYDLKDAGIDYIPIKPYVKIQGVDKARCIISFRASSKDSNKNIFQNAASGFTEGEGEVCDFTLISSNIKGALHLDDPSWKGTVYFHDIIHKEISDADTFNPSNDYYIYMNASFGSINLATHIGQTIIIENVITNGYIYSHTLPSSISDGVSQTNGGTFIVRNCICTYLMCSANGDKVRKKCVFEGNKCTFMKVNFGDSTGNEFFAWDVELKNNDADFLAGLYKPYGSSEFLSIWNSFFGCVPFADPKLHRMIQNKTGSTIARRTKVNFTDQTKRYITPAIGETYEAITMEDVTNDGFGIVQYGGNLDHYWQYLQTHELT